MPSHVSKRNWINETVCINTMKFFLDKVLFLFITFFSPFAWCDTHTSESRYISLNLFLVCTCLIKLCSLIFEDTMRSNFPRPNPNNDRNKRKKNKKKTTCLLLLELLQFSKNFPNKKFLLGRDIGLVFAINWLEKFLICAMIYKYSRLNSSQKRK